MSERLRLPAPLGGRVSQTMLRHFQGCPRSGFFYARYRGMARAEPLERGSALHFVLERAIALMIEQGEPEIPDEILKMLVGEALSVFPVPWRDHDYLRECAYRWSENFTCDPSAVVCCETLMVLDLAGWEVRCKVDFAELRDAGMTIAVKDWKSSRSAPGYEEIGRRRPDGTIAARQFQLVLYALALAYGVPVRVEERACESCDGTGFFAGERDGPGCPECEGSGVTREETREPFPLAAQAERFELELVFPGMRSREGGMVTRSVGLTRLELTEYRDSLEALLRRLTAAEENGDWPAVQSDAACGECPARQLCPIPRELNDHAGRINTYDEAVEAAEKLDRESDQLAALRAELRNLAKARDWEIRYGRDKALRFVYGESERIENKEGMFEAIERAVRYGEPFDRSRFVKTVGTNSFKVVTLTDEELQEVP